MSDLARYKAADVLGLAGASWDGSLPEALEPRQLALLQHHGKGCWRERRQFEGAIKVAIEAGIIKPEYKDETRTVQENIGECVPASDLGWGSPEWLARDLGLERARGHGVLRRHSLTRYATKSLDVRTTLIPRTEFARWWGGQKVAASEHMEAWLASGTSQCAEDESRNNRIIASLAAGKSQAAVANEFKISRGRVGQIARAARAKKGGAADSSSCWAVVIGGKTAPATKLPTATNTTVKRKV
ncbi:MAG: hypothetical protein HZC22_04505 [Rhodocyclales bacterium]|nr:hypothetical protein [Rhodocyclales bacterium]